MRSGDDFRHERVREHRFWSFFRGGTGVIALILSTKIKWLVAGVTAVGSPDRAERAISEVILAGRFFGQFRPYLLPESHFVV